MTFDDPHAASAQLLAQNNALFRNQRALRKLAALDYTDLHRAVQSGLAILAAALEVARVSVWRYEAEDRAIRCLDLIDRGAFSGDALRLDDATYPRYFAALREGIVIDAADALHDPRTSEFADGYLRPLGIAAMLDVSIEVSGAPIGILCVEHIGAPREWTLADQELVLSSASMLAIAFTLERQRDLEAQLRQAQKMEAIGLLAGGIAHDFNNVLSVILGEAEQLASDIDDREARLAAADAIRREAARATGLTRKLLTFSRQRPVALETLDLDAVVGGFERLVRRVLDAPIALRMERAGQLLPVVGDATLIEQVILNLVFNAKFAMPDGGTLDVIVRRAEGAVPQAELLVADSGVGMAPEVLARIWEPFFTTRNFGSGLGLSIVHGAVRQMGGSVHVTSDPGVGTTFRIQFPLSRDPIAAETRPKTPPRSVPLQGRVLLAEDEPALRSTFTRTLRVAGFDVVAVANGDEAVETFLRAPTNFELLVSDVSMPALDGPSAYLLMRAQVPDLPVVFVSGYEPDVERVERLAALGAQVRWLAKPIARDALLSAAAELIALRRAKPA
ncbi:MAG: response regulator [Gemmatimonadaceae bacterium]|nr:response regulator [Gemmatimonadaceae bacterium]